MVMKMEGGTGGEREVFRSEEKEIASLRGKQNSAAYYTYPSEADISVCQGARSTSPVSGVTEKRNSHEILGTAFFLYVHVCAKYVVDHDRKA